MYFQVLLIVTIALTPIISELNLNRNDACITPNKENAKCLSLYDCPIIFNAIQTDDTRALEFAQDSQCGYDADPLVCCGSSALRKLSPNGLGIFTTPPTTPPKLSIGDLPQDEWLPSREICGLGPTSFRVLGGTVTDVGEFPWMAALEFKSRSTEESLGVKCGGSIINFKYVMTAAHCLLDDQFKAAAVRLGEWKLSTEIDCDDENYCADKLQILQIKEQIPHPFYSRRSGDNDIGLLKLEGTIKYSVFVRPICLPPADLPAPAFGTRMTVIGWGATGNGTSSDILMKVQLPLLSNEECNAKFKQQISANQLCAGGEKGKDTCQGDSGGPLMNMYNDELGAAWYQEGLVAYGVGCGRPGFPAIYVRLTRYIRWIYSFIQDV